MAMQVTSHRSTRSNDGSDSSFNDVHDIETAIKVVERSLVEGNYLDALTLANQMLSTSLEQSCEGPEYASSDTNEVIALKTPLHFPLGSSSSPSLFFTVSLSSGIIGWTDRVAAVALQSCYELLQQHHPEWLFSEAQLGHFLNVYTGRKRRPMSLELSIIWVQFCFSVMNNHHQQQHHDAVEMSAEILHHVLHSSYYSPITEIAENDPIEDLVWILLTKMLPYSQSASYVQDLLDRIHGSEWTQSVPHNKFIPVPESNPQAVSMLLSNLSKFPVTQCMDFCRDRLLDLLGNDADAERTNETELSLGNDSCVERRLPTRAVQPTGECHPRLPPFLDWQRRFVQYMVHLVRVHVVKPLSQGEEQWENRGRIVISVLVMWLAWKQRRRLGSATNAVGKVILTPFREIMEAIMPQR